MPLRYYLVPISAGTSGPQPSRKPEYFAGTVDGGPALVTVDYEMLDFGLEPTGLVAANVTAQQHTTLAAQSDVTAIPVNIDNALGANLATVQAALESLHIPADALVSTNTYRQVLRATIAIFEVAARFNGLLGANGRLFPAGITLATTLGDLSQNVRNTLQSAAEALGYDYSGLTLQSTLRDVLKLIAQQAKPYTMLGVQI